MEATQQVKQIIKTRFGSMTKFAKLIGVERYELQKFFAAAEKNMTEERQAKVDELEALANKTKAKAVQTDLTPLLRRMIRLRIEKQFGGVAEFCEANPEFNVVSTWHVINGTRKTVNKKVNELLKVLKIKQQPPKHGTKPKIKFT